MGRDMDAYALEATAENIERAMFDIPAYVKQISSSEPPAIKDYC